MQYGMRGPVVEISLWWFPTELTVFEATKARPGDKRKRQRNDDAGDIEGYLGPWGKYVNEKTVMVPDEEEKKVSELWVYV